MHKIDRACLDQHLCCVVRRRSVPCHLRAISTRQSFTDPFQRASFENIRFILVVGSTVVYFLICDIFFYGNIHVKCHHVSKYRAMLLR